MERSEHTPHERADRPRTRAGFWLESIRTENCGAIGNLFVRNSQVGQVRSVSGATIPVQSVRVELVHETASGVSSDYHVVGSKCETPGDPGETPGQTYRRVESGTQNSLMSCGRGGAGKFFDVSIKIIDELGIPFHIGSHGDVQRYVQGNFHHRNCVSGALCSPALRESNPATSLKTGIALRP